MVDLWRIKELRYLVYFFAASIIISILFFAIKQTPILKTLQAVFGLLFVLFLPGYVAIRCFSKKQIDEIETIGLSFVFSLMIVIFTILFTNNILKIPVKGFYNFIIILITIILIIIIKLITKLFKK